MREVGDKLPWLDFIEDLVGIDSKTKLGQLIQIRTETRKEVIDTFSDEAKRINSEWRYMQKRKFAESLTQEEIMQGAAEQEAFIRNLMGLRKQK